MKIGIYNPYLNILGGGEKYILDIANFFSERGDTVELFWQDKKIIGEIENRYNLKIKNINFLPNIFRKKHNLTEKLLKLAKYDFFFYVTDGSLFFSPAGKNILIIQSPAHIPPKRFKNKVIIKNWTPIICYSNFVKEYILRIWQTEVFVLPPAVNIEQFKAGKKENIILSVGRFTQSLHRKKQEVLISAFKKLSSDIKNLRLILAGGLVNTDRDYFESLKEKAKGENIEFYPNINFFKIKELYGRAEVYWHAAGYGEDLKKNPERAEHFGITTVEAMSSGCIPIVFKAGGQEEIINDGENGFFWETQEELISITRKIINKPEEELRKNAINKSKIYRQEAFQKNLEKILCL